MKAILVAHLACAVGATMISSKTDTIRIRLHYDSLIAKCQSADKIRLAVAISRNFTAGKKEDL